MIAALRFASETVDCLCIFAHVLFCNFPFVGALRRTTDMPVWAGRLAVGTAQHRQIEFYLHLQVTLVKSLLASHTPSLSARQA